MDFRTKTGTDTIVVSKLNSQSNIYPAIALADSFFSQYWIVNKFGAGTFAADLTFSPDETINPKDEISPDALRLYYRESNSDGSWSDMMGASAVNAGSNTVTFDSISEFSQYLIGRQWFTDINAELTGINIGSVAWGDYDNDGDLDILLTGSVGSSRISRIYRNEASVGSERVFTDINAGLPGVNYSSVAWGDYDNDGDLDILLSGHSGSNTISRIFRNDSGVFVNINGGLISTYDGEVAWGDYDNDGDLDILLTGGHSEIYRNDSGKFTHVNSGLEDFDYGSADWGDYDNDGDLDILICGFYLDGNMDKRYGTRIYRNSAGKFYDIKAGLAGVTEGSVAWGDYDNDGDLDALISGYYYGSTHSYIARIYRNDTGTFININAGLTAVHNSSVAWGDYDNDGDLDILLSGYTGSAPVSRIYRNDTGIFTELNAGLANVSNSSITWGDYDNDGDLDILLSGSNISKIYRNNCINPNTIPSSITNIQSIIKINKTLLTWQAANDAETPQAALTYNLHIGTTPSLS